MTRKCSFLKYLGLGPDGNVEEVGFQKRATMARSPFVFPFRFFSEFCHPFDEQIESKEVFTFPFGSH